MRVVRSVHLEALYSDLIASANACTAACAEASSPEMEGKLRARAGGIFDAASDLDDLLRDREADLEKLVP